jgi:(p)ppGpp synthase/HD superfamily hydrolase
MVFEAIEFATRAHAGQYRKGTRIPYILHPLRVGSLLIEVDSPEPVVIAGILHDTVEDTPVTIAEVAGRFGDRVARLVASVSEPDKRAPWDERKRHTVEQLRSAEPDTLLIACADKLDNIRSMRRGEARSGAGFWDRFHRPREQQAWYYREVSAAIGAGADRGALAILWQKLDREVRALFD